MSFARRASSTSFLISGSIAFRLLSRTNPLFRAMQSTSSRACDTLAGGRDIVLEGR